MARNIVTTTHTARPNWRTYKFDSDKLLGQNLDGDNGAAVPAVFGEVLAGTLMSLNGSTGVRPLPLQSLSVAISAANLGQMADAANFYLGDTIDLIAGATTFDTITIDASGTGVDMDCTALEAGDSRIRIILTDPSGNNQPLFTTVSDDGTNVDIDVSLATDGGGAITTTVDGIIAEINDEAGWLVFAELTAGAGGTVSIAVVATPLAGGANIGDVLISGRDITLLDKTATPNTITFDGAAVTVPLGTVIMLQGLAPEDIAGLLERQADTSTLVNGVLTPADQQVEVAIGGYAEATNLTGWDAALLRYFTGAFVAAGVLGPGQAPIFPFVVA